MITVSILINGQPLFTRSAVNILELAERPGTCRYRLDTGEELVHKRSDGAVSLAIKMLKTIKEV